MKILSRTAIAALVVLAPLTAQGTYLSLGRGGTYAVSDDGSVIVGNDLSGSYRWTSSGGKQPLGSGVRGRMGISADGTVITANLDGSGTPSGMQEAAIWTVANPTWAALGGLPGSTGCGSLSSNYGLSADGTTAVGLGWEGCKGRAFKWTQSTGMVSLGVLNTVRSSRGNGVSGNGFVVVGWDESANTGQRRAAAWFGTNEMLLVPASSQNPERAGEAWAANTDGSLIVGGDSPTAFRWTAAGGYESLGTFPGGNPNNASGTAYATNEAGTVIVGAAGDFFTGFGAFVWTPEDKMQSLADFLADQKVTVPAGPALTWANDVSANGKFIVGQRGDFRAMNDEGFLVTLPEGLRYGVRVGGANTLDLAGSGSAQIGQQLTVTTSNIVDAVSLLLISGAADNLSLAGGTVLVSFAGAPIILPVPVIAGASTINIPIPPDPNLVDFTIYLQSFAGDASQPAGVAMSNGYKVVIHS